MGDYWKHEVEEMLAEREAEARNAALEEAAEAFEQSVNHVWDKDEVAEFLRSKITAG